MAENESKGGESEGSQTKLESLIFILNNLKNLSATSLRSFKSFSSHWAAQRQKQTRTRGKGKETQFVLFSTFKYGKT